MRTVIDPKAWVENHLIRLTQSSFRITSGAGLVAIDPFSRSPDATKADLILITHDHPDHFNARVVRSLIQAGTRVVVPASMRASGRDQGLATDALAPGDSRTLGSIAVEAVAAYNPKKPFHPKAHGFVGYIFTLDKLRIYHAGDTDLIPEMEGLKVDIALLPVGGLFTMNPDAAVRAARLVGAKVVVPMHYGKLPFTGQAGRQFATLFEGATILL